MLIPTQAFLEKVLAGLIAHAVAGPVSGPLDGLFLGLMIGPVGTLAPTMTLADFVEASYTGYARQAIVWHPPYVEGTSTETVQAASLYFTPTDAAVQQNIIGVLICDALAAGNLVLAEYWGAQGAISFLGPQSAFSYAPLFQLPGTGNYGSGVIVN